MLFNNTVFPLLNVSELKYWQVSCLFSDTQLPQQYFSKYIGPVWLNELGSWITKQLKQAYHQCCVNDN